MWAAVRFGWTPDQFRALTPAQVALLRKEDERRTVELGNLVRDAVQNAVANAMRKKGKKPQPLFRKRPKKQADQKKKLSKKKLRRIEESARRLKVR